MDAFRPSFVARSVKHSRIPLAICRSIAHYVKASAVSIVKASVSKGTLKGFRRGLGFLIHWQFEFIRSTISAPGIKAFATSERTVAELEDATVFAFLEQSMR